MIDDERKADNWRSVCTTSIRVSTYLTFYNHITINATLSNINSPSAPVNLITNATTNLNASSFHNFIYYQ